MNTFWKISLGFVLGVVSTFGVLYVMGTTQKTEEEELRDEIRIQALKNLKESIGDRNIDEYEDNNESFELTTQKGVVKLHTNMPKDSVKILMGRPKSTSIDDSGFNGEVVETWKYKGSNTYIDEFTILFSNGKLKSLSQYKDH
jgi:hypothetical protein